MSRDIPAGVWDPAQYGAFHGERGRAFFELLGRVAAVSPARVVDLGCGSGELTLALARRWPGALVEGVDSSPEMIAMARERRAAEPDDATADRVRFSVGDVRDWRPSGRPDVIVSNAVLHWVPEHRDLLPRWLDALRPGGWLAFQVPGNAGAPSHTLLRGLADSPRWRDRLADRVRAARELADADGYLDQLARLGARVDAWETTYVQVLQGTDPVLEWVKGSTLRPVLAALDEPAAAEFLAEYGALLRDAYPPGPYGTVFPFRRVFVVARRAAG